MSARPIKLAFDAARGVLTITGPGGITHLRDYDLGRAEVLAQVLGVQLS